MIQDAPIHMKFDGISPPPRSTEFCTGSEITVQVGAASLDIKFLHPCRVKWNEHQMEILSLRSVRIHPRQLSVYQELVDITLKSGADCCYKNAGVKGSSNDGNMIPLMENVTTSIGWQESNNSDQGTVKTPSVLIVARAPTLELGSGSNIGCNFPVGHSFGAGEVCTTKIGDGLITMTFAGSGVLYCDGKALGIKLLRKIMTEPLSELKCRGAVYVSVEDRTKLGWVQRANVSRPEEGEVVPIVPYSEFSPNVALFNDNDVRVGLRPTVIFKTIVE